MKLHYQLQSNNLLVCLLLGMVFHNISNTQAPSGLQYNLLFPRYSSGMENSLELLEKSSWLIESLCHCWLYSKYPPSA